MRILILEDDRATAQLLGLLLTSSGHTVVHALDGTEGLKQLRAAPSDLVISDVQMVPMDGFGFLKGARVEFPRILVVLASACSDLHVRIEQQPHKPFDVVHKPFRIEEVRRVLARAEEALAMQATVARSAVAADVRTPVATPSPLNERLAPLFPGQGYMTTRASLTRAIAHPGYALLVAPRGVLTPDFFDLWRAGSPQPNAVWKIVDAVETPEAVRGLIDSDDLARGGTWVVQNLEAVPVVEQVQLLASSRRLPPTRLIVTVRRDPDVLLEEGRLDEALYFRLSSLTVPIPPLADLSEHLDALFIDALRLAPGYPFGGTDVTIEPVALTALKAHPWKDNLAELRGVAVWTLTQMRSPRVTLANLPERFHRARLATLAEALGEAQREHLERALRVSGSSIEAAHALGVGVEEFSLAVEPGGPLLFSLAGASASPFSLGEGRDRSPVVLFVSADPQLRHAAEAQLAALGVDARIAADGLQALAQSVLSPRRPSVAMLAGRSAPFEVEELIAQLRRLTPSLVVAKIGVGEETDGAHYFPPLEGMDLFPVIVAHLLQSIPKSVPPAGRTPSTAGGVAARSVASPGSGPYRVALAADVPARA
jgi:DNA-binding NtrC family response regulator